MFIAVVKTEGDRVAKYMAFQTQAEAEAHVVTTGGFVSDDVGTRWPHWRVEDGRLVADPQEPEPVPEPPLSPSEIEQLLISRGVATKADIDAVKAQRPER